MNRLKKTIGILVIFSLILALFFVFPVGKTKSIYASVADGRALGVDVSNHNGSIDWAKAKAGGVEFAIIRIGWGDNLTRQDDPNAVYNMVQCEKLGIPYGVYIYSYAISTAEVDSEIEHTIRMIQGRNPTLGIWFDMEDADFYKANHNFNPYTHGSQLTDFCLRYLRGMKARGYSQVGVYANPDYFRNVLNYNKIKAEGMIWLAHWGVNAPSYDCALWQYSAEGRIAGGSGVFDMNRIFAGSPLFPYLKGSAVRVETITRASGAPIIYGDINGDGIISLSDLSLLKMSVIGRASLSGDAGKCADVTKDGKLTLADITLMKQHLLKSIDLNKSAKGADSSADKAALQEETVSEEDRPEVVPETEESSSETEAAGQEETETENSNSLFTEENGLSTTQEEETSGQS